VVGANAVVLHDVPDDGVVAGVPARLLRINEPPDPDDVDSRIARAWRSEHSAGE
jgi:serine acetyltransferase